MKPLRKFEEFLEEGIVKKQRIDPEILNLFKDLTRRTK